MTNKERFYEAFAHTEHVVFGRRLRRFTLRHRFWLEALNCPAVVGGDVDWPAIELAVRICGLPHERIDEGVKRLLARGPRWWEGWLFLWRAWRGDMRREYEAFIAYMEDHGCAPERSNVGGKCSEREVMPGLISLVAGVVRSSGGWEPDTVWALSPGEAEWYCTACYMHRGVDMGLKTEHDEEFERGLAEHGEEIRAMIAEAKRKKKEEAERREQGEASREADGLTGGREHGEQSDESHGQCAGAEHGTEQTQEPVGGLCGDAAGAGGDSGERGHEGASTVERGEGGVYGEGAGAAGTGCGREPCVSGDDEATGDGVEGAGDELGGDAGADDDSIPPVTGQHGTGTRPGEGADGVHGEDTIPPRRDGGGE